MPHYFASVVLVCIGCAAAESMRNGGLHIGKQTILQQSMEAIVESFVCKT